MVRLLQRLIAWGWPARLLAPLLGRYVPWQPDLRRDPYPTYERLREGPPLYWAPFGVWVASRYDEVLAILRDRRFTADRSELAPVRFIRHFVRLDPAGELELVRDLAHPLPVVVIAEMLDVPLADRAHSSSTAVACWRSAAPRRATICSRR